MTTVKEPPNGSKSLSFFRSVVSKLKPPTAPVSSGAQQPTQSSLKSHLSDTQSRKNVSRCEFTFSDDRRCRNERASLCAHHTPKQNHGGKSAALNAPELEALCSNLTTATTINRALAQTFLLMAQGRISRKDAVAFGYLSQLMLQTVSGVRAEYVAAFGYRQWENKLKTSVMPGADGDPEPSPGGDSGPSGGGDKNLEQRRNRVVEPKKAERPLAERIMGEPDYADILSRSLDLFDRKYDFTPEGRSEAKKLALELELMKPAPAKPAKDFFGQTVDLMRRVRDAENNATDGPEPSSLPKEAFLAYDGHPIKPAFRYEGDTATPGCAPQSSSPSRSESPTVPNPATYSSAPVAAAVLQPQRSCAPSASNPPAFVAPPSRRHRKPRQRTAPPPSSLPKDPAPFTVFVAPESGPDDEPREGHRADWYAPPSWSGHRTPEPFPSRKEKLRRKIRSLTNSAFRRLQHQNSRGSSTKGLQKLIP